MIINGDALTVLGGMKDESVHCCVTSPPYWGLRDYGVEGQLGLEKTPEEYVDKMVGIFREVRRVLRDDGTLWLNLGDSYVSQPAGNKTPNKFMAQVHQSARENENDPKRATSNRTSVCGLQTKQLLGIPWRVAFALQQDGWYLRCDIIWAKPNPMPESVKDRPTKAHEYIFLMSKNQRYYYDGDAIREELAQPDRYKSCLLNYENERKRTYGDGTNVVNPKTIEKHRQKVLSGELEGRNKHSVWNIATHPYPDAHFAVFPPKLIEPCILAGCPEGGTVLDPFFGSGTTGLVAKNSARKYIGIELNEEYIQMAKKRLSQGVLF